MSQETEQSSEDFVAEQRKFTELNSDGQSKKHPIGTE